jgi:O-antigen ligase
VDWAEDATGSAWARQFLFILSVKTTLANPLFGVGPGNFQVVSGQWHGTHNTYTQFSSEAGIPALVLFIAILVGCLKNLRRVRKMTSEKDPLWVLATGLRASFWGLIVGGLFGMAAYNFFAYFMIGYSCVLYKLALEARASSTPAEQLMNRESSTRLWWRKRSEQKAEPMVSPPLRRGLRPSGATVPERMRTGD